MAKIIPFKTRRQLETEKAVKVMREWEANLEWEEANWHHVIERETEEEEEEEEEEQNLSFEEIEWLNEWVKENE
ncbi:hypothetical protein CSV67_03405 [Sporosarcina sp. P2]|uniref:hypothetical protein n=1 Tax=Sporosarcina sp. P2 TaxID=2048251 RepID=UPI000C16E55B|nr:hypothetical protein [Sporosarcina sp. P2]PID03703.1 hypothetical protein CSV67_03405 [Sporosarcina sp. P2]